MLSFNKFAGKKKCVEFLDNFRQACKNNPYSEEAVSVGSFGGFDILKAIMNPGGRITIGFVGGLEGDDLGGSYGMLEFVRSNMRIPSDIRVIIMPLVNPDGLVNGTEIKDKFLEESLDAECKSIWNALKAENLQLLYLSKESKEANLYYTHHRRLAEELRDLVKQRGFRTLEEGLTGLPHDATGSLQGLALSKNIPYIVAETPNGSLLKKGSNINKELMKFVIHNI